MRPRRGNCFSGRLHRVCGWSRARKRDDVLADKYKSPQDRPRRQASTGLASGLKHPLNAGVHFRLVETLAPGDLVNADLDLLLEPLVLSKKLGDSFLQEIVGAATGPGGELVELNFLVLK